MNANITKALFRDAMAQVVDNRVFRILFVVLCVMVLPTFLIGAREERLSLLFLWHYEYEEIFGIFGGGLTNFEHPNQQLIQTVQRLFVDGIAGPFGILFGVAATAFFLPRMLEKGAADVVFSKPVSRLSLLLSRYAAGLIFAALLAVALIGGMHLGFSLVSGWSDPGFLWSIPILIYVFGVVHAVSLVVGVFTRSSVAAILVTLLFYAANGCVHNGWVLKESQFFDPDLEAAKAVEPGTPRTDQELGGFLPVVLEALDVVHFVLPKTNEADFLAKSVRRRIETRGFEIADADSGFTVRVPPSGMTRVVGSELDGDGVAWRAVVDGQTQAEVRISRRPVKTAGSRMSVAKALEKELAQREGVTDVTRKNEEIADRPGWCVRWTEAGANGPVHHQSWFFDDGASRYQLERRESATWRDDPANKNTLRDFHRSVTFNAEDVHIGNSIGQVTGIDRRYGWTAPWRYNYFFSIGSTVAFVVAMLALANWKLSRIDF